MADRHEIERLLALARADNDPVGIAHWSDELLRLDSPAAFDKLRRRAAALRAEANERDEADAADDGSPPIWIAWPTSRAANDPRMTPAIETARILGMRCDARCW